MEVGLLEEKILAIALFVVGQSKIRSEKEKVKYGYYKEDEKEVLKNG